MTNLCSSDIIGLGIILAVYYKGYSHGVSTLYNLIYLYNKQGSKREKMKEKGTSHPYPPPRGRMSA